ncbi:MAG: hypothetical protein HY228_00550 [Candidatus Yonathbacteria bacterium]|nr:hypothetical protein [Candidatus Yonathbacteria bacterium]
MGKIEDQFLVPSIEERKEAIEKLPLFLQTIFLKHLPKERVKEKQETKLPPPREKRLKDAEIHELNLMKGIPLEDR